MGVGLVFAAGATAAGAPTVKSNFSSDVDGWAQVANFYGLSALEDPGYTSSGGHPGGAIFAKDEDSGPGEQTEALLNYNGKFNGDFSAYYKGKIAFDLRDNRSSSGPVRLGFHRPRGFLQHQGEARAGTGVGPLRRPADPEGLAVQVVPERPQGGLPTGHEAAVQGWAGRATGCDRNRRLLARRGREGHAGQLRLEATQALRAG